MGNQPMRILQKRGYSEVSQAHKYPRLTSDPSSPQATYCDSPPRPRAHEEARVQVYFRMIAWGLCRLTLGRVIEN